MSAEDERTWGAVSHAGAVVAMICSAGFLGFLASVAVYVIHKDRGPFVRAHAANSLNIQITMFIWLVVLGILTIPVALLTFGLGLVVMVPALVAAFVVAGDPARHRRDQGLQRRVVEPAVHAPLREVTLS